MNKQETQVFNNNGSPVDFEATKAADVTKSDTTVLSPGALYVGTGGDVSVILVDNDSSVVFKNVADGTFMPIKVKQVLAATTASDILILR